MGVWARTADTLDASKFAHLIECYPDVTRKKG